MACLPPNRIDGIAARVPVLVTWSSSRTTSAARCGRDPASLARHCITRRANSGGVSGRSSSTGRGISVICATSSFCGASPLNGARPVSSSYATQPNAYRSARWSTAGSAATCSGAMYAGVPNDVPNCVSVAPVTWPRASLNALAMPKSVTTAEPPERSTFSGLMSRCTTPCSCAYASARATSRRMLMTSVIGSAPSFASRARSDSPSTNGIV